MIFCFIDLRSIFEFRIWKLLDWSELVYCDLYSIWAHASWSMFDLRASKLTYVNMRTGSNSYLDAGSGSNCARIPTAIALSIFLTGVDWNDKSYRSTYPPPTDFLYVTGACLTALSACWKKKQITQRQWHQLRNRSTSSTTICAQRVSVQKWYSAGIKSRARLCQK